MPLPVESLNKDSGIDQVRKAISASIAQCVKEGKDQKQCAAIAYEMARKQTGKSLGEGRAT